MTRAGLLAALACALGVAAAWEALGALALARGPAWIAGALEPLRRAGREGREPARAERRRLAVLAAAVLLVGGWILAGALAGVALAALAPWAAVAAIRRRRARFRAELARSAPIVARTLADAIAGGAPVRAALALAAGHLDGAAGAELSAARAALAAGAPTPVVLERLRRRADVRAWDAMVAAVLLAREAGGDLAGLLRRLAAAQEERLRLEGEARTATSQARFTGLIVCVLPLGAAALAELASPGYLGALAGNSTSRLLVLAALLCQGGSLLAIRRLARVGET